MSLDCGWVGGGRDSATAIDSGCVDVELVMQAAQKLSQLRRVTFGSSITIGTPSEASWVVEGRV